MPNKIIFFSDSFMPTLPYLELPMYRYIENNGISVVFVLQEGDIRLTDPSLKKEFSRLRIKLIKKPKHLPSLMSKGDVLLMRFAYKLAGGDAASAVRDAGHKILQYDPGGVDIRFRESPAQYLTSKSESLKRAVMKKFPKHYKHIFVTGTIHYDSAAITSVGRTEFMKSYGLDPNKKFALLIPSNPGEAWMEGLQDDYKQIVKIVTENCPNYELAIKCHHLDYTANMPMQPGIVHKSQHYGSKSSWEVLAPNLPVIKPEEGYMSIKACDVVLNIRSSLAIEIPLFVKPLININRYKYVTNWPFDRKVMIDIKMGELADMLNANNYCVGESACRDYIKREAYSDDGKAYERTGDIAIKILEGKI